MPWEQMSAFFKSWFDYPGITAGQMISAVIIGIVFGAVWLLFFWPSFSKKIWFWPLMIITGLLTILGISFIQIPLQNWASQGLSKIFDENTLVDWFLITGMPTVLITGLVQEAFKSIPVTVWWWRSGRTLTPKMGLIIGAVAGAGFGIFEAIWDGASVLGGGWTFDAVSTYGFSGGMYPFIIRIFCVGFHIAASALVGYGLAKRKWWQYFLIAAVLHALLNYSTILSMYLTYVKPQEWLGALHVEIYIAVIAVIATAWALVIRWRKEPEIPIPPASPMDTIIPPELVAPIQPVAPPEPLVPPALFPPSGPSSPVGT
jgi:RsiW-degrading membrane proteinase PrsW (M82 family)